ncbi:MAG TPA: hypothetical protein VHT27_07975 [Solirubrobacteraceae bacterium]|jgi:hypothetical protein|nr:hypothetical protein [Solirubrobacteraceae bacterium]
MGPRPWRPAAELEGALDRGDLRHAMSLAEELRIERGRPIDLDTAERFLPLIAAHSPGEYDAWAMRWLTRWLVESGAPTVDEVVAIARRLATLREGTGVREQ